MLGPRSKAEGKTAEYVLPLREGHSVHGQAVRAAGLFETDTEMVFQQLGGGRVACGGELYLLADGAQPAMDALEAAGLHVAARHNHTLDESPTMYWMHRYGTGDGAVPAPCGDGTF